MFLTALQRRCESKGPESPRLTSHASAPRVSANRPKVYDRLTPEAVLDALRRMHRIRRFEEAAEESYIRGLSYGTMHLSIGQEATAVGVCVPLADSDFITSTHRGHGHCLAKGLDPAGMFAELMGRDQGTNRGRGGSMHIADPKLGIFGANGIVAAGLPIAAGAATAARAVAACMTTRRLRPSPAEAAIPRSEPR